MAKKQTYLVTSNFTTPYVVSSHNPRNPTETKWKRFRKGEMLSGEMIFDKGKPNFVLYDSVCVIPLSVIRAVVTKEIVSNATGPIPTTPLGQDSTKKIVKVENPKTRYVDAMLVGALIGVGGVYLANKKGWIAVPDKMHYAYGAGGAALLAAYFIYRQNNKPKIKTV
jgi:hypothetical protein